MLKIAVIVLIAITLVPITSAFAEGKIEINSDQNKIKPTDTVFVYGKVTGVTNYIPVKLTVLAPDGEIVFSPQLKIAPNGEFKRLIHPPLPSFKIGTYTVVASHDNLDTSARIQFNVAGQSLVKETPLIAPGTGDKKILPGLEISAIALEGSDTITITGTPVSRDTAITFTIYSPTGKLVSVEQITPQTLNPFTIEIKTGGPLWTEDGTYTITANQGIASEFQDSVEVEIVKGRIIPEFGSITAMILVISIISIIAISAKSKLSVLPRF